MTQLARLHGHDRSSHARRDSGRGAGATGRDAAATGPHPLAFRRLHGRKLRINVLSETALLGLEHQGGHTGFLDCVELMSRHPDLEIEVNGRGAADILHAHSWGPLYLWRGIGHARRRIFTSHVLPETAEGAMPFAKLGAPLIHRYLKLVYGYSDVVVAVGPRMATRLREQLGVRCQIRTIPNPLRSERFHADPALRAEGRKLLGITSDRPVVLGVGQLQPRKGIPDFVKVAWGTPEADFVWVGGRPFGMVSAGIAELRRLEANLPPNMRFAGMFALDRMPAIYNAADVFLFPSLQENCPYAPLEAAGCGLPIVLRDLPEYRALYRSAMLTARDPLGFTAVVNGLLRSKSQREHWSRASSRLARDFTPEAYIEATAALYDHVACGRLHPRAVEEPLAQSLDMGAEEEPRVPVRG
jgi:1,2-diacylglycerol-3-alpha-glucose alpha-1,2-galactosyltransferase